MDSPSTSTTTHRKPTGDHQSSETSAQPDSTEGASQPSSTSGTFECHICLDSARDAVVSMCGHLFCWPCLYQWLETSKSCPVCKSAISQDRVVPLYGRGSDHTRDPRSKIPPRPAGRRAEPESNAPGFGGVFNNLFGNTDGNSNFRMSVGIGAFPFGFLATAFNFGGDAPTPSSVGPGSNDVPWSADAETMSKLCLFVAIFFIVWLLIA